MYLTSAKVTLTNEKHVVTSPLFSAFSQLVYNEKIDFEHVSIGKVGYEGGTNNLVNLKFYDRSGSEIDGYTNPNPYFANTSIKDSYPLSI